MKLQKEAIQKKAKQSTIQSNAIKKSLEIGLIIIQSRTKSIILAIIIIFIILLSIVGIGGSIYFLIN